MKRYILYDPATEEIVKFGTCSDHDYDIQAIEGLVLIEGIVIDETHVRDGIPVKLLPAVPSSESVKRHDDLVLAQKIVSRIPDYLFEIENRLLAIEGKAPVTWEQFKAAVRGMR